MSEQQPLPVDENRLIAERRAKLAALRTQGIALVNMGSERYVPAANITGAEAFTKDDAERLKGEDYTLSQTFRAKVETKAGTILSSATPAQVMNRRAKAIEAANSNNAAAPKAKIA